MYPPCPFLVHQMVHFDFPRADERQICSIQCCGQGKLIVSPPRGSSRDRLAALRSYPGPVIVVFVDRNGKYLTDYGSVGIHLRHMHRLLLQVVKRLEGDAKPLQQSDTTRLDELSITATSSSYKQDTIWLRPECTWGLDFYTRVDHAGSFHTYPHVGRPSHNLDEVSEAIDRYLFRHLDPKMHREQDLVSQENKCTLEMAIWRHIHWPDGTRKSHLRTLPLDERRCSMLQLVKALMDKYNDDHNLSGDLAYELPCVGRYRYFHDADIKGIYYHINFTANTKVSDDSGLDNLLFFAELVERGRNELVVSCICRVNPSEDCRSRGMFCCDGPEENLGCTPSELEAEEMSARSMYEGLDPSCFLVRQNQVRC
ncbi:uncharacterized protein [Lolium perenne]|uniref:uncharacterized protein isoform X2 n=1 Tax=Lolium perenne TaxID=4522 RepID=UPI0021F5CD12|nr:uncharacterized protein LOC127332056 isoform X2 [Lolium perenne]